MVQYSITFDKTPLDKIRIQIVTASPAIVDYAVNEIPAVLQKDITPLTTEPREPTLPFVWSTDPVKQARARRWYFANKVRGNPGGRYARKHELVRRWQTEARRLRDGAEISTFNDTPGIEYVQGPQQVPSHRDSGWERYDVVLPQAGEKAATLIANKWLHSLDE
jgi:hypothetical protein